MALGFLFLQKITGDLKLSGKNVKSNLTHILALSKFIRVPVGFLVLATVRQEIGKNATNSFGLWIVTLICQRQGICLRIFLSPMVSPLHFLSLLSQGALEHIFTYNSYTSGLKKRTGSHLCQADLRQFLEMARHMNSAIVGPTFVAASMIHPAPCGVAVAPQRCES